MEGRAGDLDHSRPKGLVGFKALPISLGLESAATACKKMTGDRHKNLRTPQGHLPDPFSGLRRAVGDLDHSWWGGGVVIVPGWLPVAWGRGCLLIGNSDKPFPEGEEGGWNRNISKPPTP